jgi:protein SCO1/2
MTGSVARFRLLLLAASALLPLDAGLASDPFRLTEWPAAAVRPSFHLVDVDGHRRTPGDYAGTVSIVFFGFAHCPDICPGELFKLSQVVHKLGPLAPQVHVLFISLDPERDSPAALKGYVTFFDSGFVGLTGSNAEINDAVTSFSVQFAKVPVGKDYTIEHSTGTYLLDQSGSLRLIGTLKTTVDDWVHDVRILLE